MTTKPKAEDILPKRSLLQRLNWVQTKVDYIQKEKKQGMRYTIVSHDAVTAKVRPLLVEAGVVYYPVHMTLAQNGNRTEMTMAVRFVNVDDEADYIDVMTAGYGIDDQDKGPGKAISYCVKYALLKALGLETGDDPDYDQDVRHKPDERKFDQATIEAALVGFGAEVASAHSIDKLSEISGSYTYILNEAKTQLPTGYLKARQAYTAKLAELKGESK